MKIDNVLLYKMAQIDQGTNKYLIEEMAELTQAFMKQERGQKNANVIEELADVYCTMMVYCHYKGISENTLVNLAEHKIKRELKRCKHD